MVHPFYFAIAPSFPLHHFPSSDIQVGDAPLSTDGLLNLPKKYVFIGFPYFFTENYNTFQ